MNPKTAIHPLSQGINFLKFKFKLTATGKVIRILNRKSLSRIKHRLRGLVRKYHDGERERKDVLNSFTSWKAHAEQGNSYKKIRRTKQWLNQLL